jgi:oligopeptide transport system permease protein
MLTLISRRLIQFPLILLAIYTITLFLAWKVPGSPLDKGEGRQPPPEVQEAMLRQYKLDSFWSFYWSYLESSTGVKYVRESLDGSAEAQAAASIAAGRPAPVRRVFDLGPSLTDADWRVNEIIGASLPVSMALGVASIIIALAIGIPAGVIGAMRPNSFADFSTLMLALIGISLPSFVIGTVLLMVFAVAIPIVPVGFYNPRLALLGAFTLSLPIGAYIARLTRLGMIDVLGADFIRTARAKGLSERRVILRHALKNAALPVVSYIGPATAAAMTGSFVVERVFNIAGMGQHFVSAVANKDLFLIIGVVMTYSTMLISLNLIVDILYRWIDPRIT